MRPPPVRRVRWGILVVGIIFVALATLVLLVVLYPSWFGLGSSTYPRFGLFGGAFLLFFLLIVGFFIVRVAFWSTRASRYGGGGGGYGRYGGGPGMGANRPLYVARMRYARGEITKEQYDQIVQDLGHRPGPPS
jgi:putative membrane protein